MKKRILAVVLAVLMAASVFAGGAKTAKADEKLLRTTQATGGVIDPAVGMDTTSCIAYVNMYESLVYTDLNNESQPQLATDYTVSDDGLVWTFNMRDNSVFHDGTPLTANDVVYSYDRLTTLGEGFAYLFTNYVEKCEALDDYTVQFTLVKAFAPFIAILPRLYVVNAAQVEANKADGQYGEHGDYGKSYLAEHDAGSGPYKLESIQIGSQFNMVSFEGYFEPLDENAPTTIEVIMNTEAASVKTRMSSGELEVSDQWQTTEAYNSLAALDGVSVGSFPAGALLYVMLNTKKAPTDDIHVRKAMAYMFDYDQITEYLFPGYLKVASSVSTSAFGYSDAGYDYEFNLEKAEEELKQSPYYDDIKSGALSIEIEWVSDVPDEEKVALLFQAIASMIGVKVDVTKVPWATHVEKVANIDSTPNASVCFLAGDYAEAGAFLYSRFSSETAGTWQQCEWLQDPELDAMINDALTTTDNDERVAKYAAIQQIISENVYGIPLAEEVERHAYVDRLMVPAIDSVLNGGSAAIPLGYNFMFKDYRFK